ncbi:MAG: hypothetical protein WBQ89_14750, partial [Candidatus Acidiferrum sp.]
AQETTIHPLVAVYLLLQVRAPEHLAFGGGAQETTIHPVVAVYLLLAIVLVVCLPRSKAIAPFLFAFFTIPIGQVVVLGALHFTPLRFLILAGLARRAFSRRLPCDRLGGIDWAVVLWSISAAVCACLEWKETGEVVRQAGSLLDTLGGFLVIRFLIPDGETMRRTFKTLAAICTVFSITMVIEQVKHVNVFGLLGGMSTEVAVRNGQARSGATLGYLYAGAFAGVLIPMFVWLWTKEKSRIAACAGVIGATVVVITSHSSTSLLALAGSILGLVFWPLRNRMRMIRWGLVCILVTLHIVMKAPVWALIQRIDLTGSSSGSQRYLLVDMTIRHFTDWWLTGTKAYVDWGYSTWDLCNQFVAVALTGGLLTLIFYIAIFQRGFSLIGTARKSVMGDRDREWLLWCVGSSLFATVVAHFGINYMAQLIMGFFTLVVCIVVATSEARQAAIQTVATPAPARGQLAPAPRAAVGTLALRKVKPEMGYGASKPKRERPIWSKA